ncbi:MAG: hypothetical protein IPO36_18595 [Anaerolineales bacterium]|nr:hypothetical protein [Anaerolineales bacterium]
MNIRGRATGEITVRNNLIYYNHIAGLAMGGYDTQRSNTENSTIVNNTFFGNNSTRMATANYGFNSTPATTSSRTISSSPIHKAGSSPIHLQNQNNVVDYSNYFAPLELTAVNGNGKAPFIGLCRLIIHHEQRYPLHVHRSMTFRHFLFQNRGTLSGSPPLTQRIAPARRQRFHRRPSSARRRRDIGADEYSSSLFAVFAFPIVGLEAGSKPVRRRHYPAGAEQIH